MDGQLHNKRIYSKNKTKNNTKMSKKSWAFLVGWLIGWLHYHKTKQQKTTTASQKGPSVSISAVYLPCCVCVCAGFYYSHVDTWQKWQQFSRSIISPADNRGATASDQHTSGSFSISVSTRNASHCSCTHPGMFIVFQSALTDQNRHTAQTGLSIQWQSEKNHSHSVFRFGFRFW